MEGFDATKSQVADDRLAQFLASEVSQELQSVPGIGPVNEKALGENAVDFPVTTTYQLIGKYLSLRSKDMSSQDHLDAFWNWLKSKGVTSYRSGIVLCVAEKANVMIPGLCDLPTRMDAEKA